MSNYTKTTDFEAKDSLPTGDSGKIIRGAEFETEFDAISTAIATKADTAGPTFTGTLTFETISDGTIGVTAFVDEDDMSSDSATLVPTQQSVKAYVDSQVTAQDLDFQADSGGALSIDLDSETLTFTGGTGIDTSGSGNAVTFAIDSTVATLTGTQTLTNKTLTSPDVNTPDIDGGTIDGTVIGGTTAAAGSFTTVSATGNITVGGTVDGRDVATDGTKLDTVETNADVTDTANVTAAGALMDSELTSEASVKALDQGVATTDSPTFAGVTVNGTVEFDGLSGTGAVNVTDILDQDDMSSNSATALATQQSIKAYVDSQVATADTLSEVLANGNTTGGTDIAFGDNDKAIFGAGSDLQIYSDGTDGYIDNVTGDFYIRDTTGGTLHLQAKTGEEGIVINDDGSVDLYRNNVLKMSTTSTGIDVTGTAVTDGLTSAVTDGSSFAANFSHTGGSVGRNGIKITSSGTSGTSTLIEALRNTTNTVFKVDGSGNLILNDQSGNQNHLLNVTGAATFNDQGADADFRVESSNQTHALFVDAGTDRVGVFNSSPATALDVTGTVTADGLTVDGTSSLGSLVTITGTAPRIELYETDTTNINGRIDSSGGDLNIKTIADDGGSQQTRIKVDHSTGDISFYEDTGTTAKLFWDAAAERLGLGTTSPNVNLDIESSSEVGLDLNCTAGKVFRLRSTTSSEFIVRDSTAGADRFVINSSGIVDIKGAGSAAAPSLILSGDDDTGQFRPSANQIAWATGGVERLRLKSSEVVVNEGSADVDFRVESNNNTHALFVDAGNDRVGINASAPTGKLEIAHDFAASTADRLLYLNSAGGLSGGLASPVYGLYADIYGNNSATEIYGAYINAEPGTGDPTYGLYAQTTQTASNQLSVAIYGKGETTSATTGQDPAGADAVAGVYAKGSTTGTDFNSTVTALTAHNESTYGLINYGAYIKTEVPTTPASTDSVPLKVLYGSSDMLTVHAQHSETVFNDSSLDHDFRVESDVNAYAFFMNGANGRIGLNKSSPGTQLDILANAGEAHTLRVSSNNISGGYASFYDNYNGQYIGYIGSGKHLITSGLDAQDFTVRSDGNLFLASSGGVERARITSSATVFNEQSNDTDFRVESNANANMLFVDAGNDRVGIGTTPSVRFEVSKNENDSTELIRVINTDSGASARSFVKTQSDTGHGQFGAVSSGWTADTRISANHAYAYGSEGFTLLTETTKQLKTSVGSTNINLFTSGSNVFNESGADVDFRVESDNSAYAVYVDAAQDSVGILTNATDAALNVNSQSGTKDAIRIVGSGGNNFIAGYGNQGNLAFTIAEVGADDPGVFTLYRNGIASHILDPDANSETVFNEQGENVDFRIESDGNAAMLFVDASSNEVNIGGSSFGSNVVSLDAGRIRVQKTTDWNMESYGDSSSNAHIRFLHSGTQVGGITTTTLATTYSTSSDSRLKENITDADDAGELIDTIQVRQFDWIANGEHQRYGMVAQELNTVAPEAVSEGETEEDMMGVDYSKLVPMLVKEIQSLRARVAQLESN